METKEKLPPEVEIETLKNILRKLLPEKSGQYFICGRAGGEDEFGLPEHVFICPTYGLDGFAIYTKTKEYSAPGY